ncbi:TIGR04211 family SH3 domain-containing protein [Ectothiorhodospira sp. BSL-9]|uniref:TIGR04211 family SH3 domain-containing protein n=1 Tax=Ectothiorhodospira sp. BSL-9 TaxID=1442136 RepID=UPI0009ED3A22|nr:TIGR04211 family SH3 domain-containing protein [Ectothiorhodospira sp. BSL-9]
MKRALLAGSVCAVALSLTLVVSPPAMAQSTAYISDELEVDVRRGQTLQHRILTFLSSGTRVTVLDEDGDYTLIRTSGGTEGWVQTRYLMDRPHAREQLSDARDRVQSLAAERDGLNDRLQALRDERDEESERAESLAALVADLEAELDNLREVAAEPLETARENEELRQSLSQEQQRVSDLLDENRALRGDERLNWFLYGGGVAIGSLILGILLTRVRLRRRQSGWID